MNDSVLEKRRHVFFQHPVRNFSELEEIPNWNWNIYFSAPTNEWFVWCEGCVDFKRNLTDGNLIRKCGKSEKGIWCCSFHNQTLFYFIAWYVNVQSLRNFRKESFNCSVQWHSFSEEQLNFCKDSNLLYICQIWTLIFSWKIILIWARSKHLSIYTRVGIKGSWLVIHESISWSHLPKIHKTPILLSIYLSRVKRVRLIDERKIPSNILVYFKLHRYTSTQKITKTLHLQILRMSIYRTQ